MIIGRHIVQCLVGMLLLHEVVENVPEHNLVARDLAVQDRHLHALLCRYGVDRYSVDIRGVQEKTKV